MASFVRLLYVLSIPAGYCFIEFRDAASANNALLKLNGKGIPGSQPVSAPARLRTIAQSLQSNAG